MRSLKSFYHALVPPPVRYPIGRWRRGVADRCRRWLTPGPLPPRHLLARIQETPWIREYLTVGAKSAQAVRGALGGLGPGQRKPRVLDFGCGLGRTLRFLEDAGWELHGCDVDRETLAWSARRLPFVRFETSAASPPLPYPARSFEAIYAVSVFTHFDAGEQASWARELGRVLVPGGRAVISTMGPRAFASFPVLAVFRDRFEREGFFLHLSDPESEVSGARGYFPARSAFSLRGAFHTRAGLERFFDEVFEIESWAEGALDGFQDLTVLRRRPTAAASYELTPAAGNA